MADLFNVYCDESCHLEHDRINVMVLGAMWCKADRSRAISRQIRDIKAKYKLKSAFEIKWTKVSPGKVDFYLSLIEYFRDEPDLHFRAVIIPNKRILDHASHQQNHDDWYYKMCFTMLEPIIDPTQRYRIYLDIKDTRSEQKRAKLEDVLRNSRHDADGHVIERVQQIHSRESDVLQLADLLIGAVTYQNRGLATNTGKLEVIRRLQRVTGKTLTHTTWLRESKCNLLRWEPREGSL